MSKRLTVVAFVLLVLAGAVGMRNIAAANAAALSVSNGSLPVAIWAQGGPIPPMPPPGGKH
jgi:hypothetical protein